MLLTRMGYLVSVSTAFLPPIHYGGIGGRNSGFGELRFLLLAITAFFHHILEQ